jgi:N-acetylglucosaminyldiphosphoundecaprenol N-acetyl-beta-D-mannosaminyltransferase
MSRVKILGVPIDCVTQAEAVGKMLNFLHSPGQHHVVAPNPEALVEARKNPVFRAVLLESALNIPDGVGLILAARALGRMELRERAVATDTFPAFCDAAARELRLFLLGAEPGVADRAAEELRWRSPGLEVVGTCAGSPALLEEEEIRERVNRSGANALFVAYGSPQQDIWIARNLPKMPGVKVAMGVGGLLDFLAGKQKRAPRSMRKAGLEWVWRFARDPRRAKRMWNAVVVFPWMVLRGPKVPKVPTGPT